MGWVTLTEREMSLRTEINSRELRDIQISREIRSLERNMSFQESIFNKNKKRELAEAKSELNAKNAERPDPNEDKEKYSQWSVEYADIKAAYEEAKVEINEYYDDLKNDLEEETTDFETEKQEEQTSLESQLESIRAELESVGEQVKSDIDSTKIKLS